MFARRVMFLAVLTIAMAACPRDQDTPPQNDTGTSTTMDITGPSTTMTSTSMSGTGDTNPADTTAGSESSTGEVDCLGPMDCWNCDPVEPEQILNRCSSADCEPFENTPERLPLLERDGSLPPIP